MIRVGVISDTHGLLRPEALTALAGVDLIVHAGDVGDEGIIRKLERIAPVHAVRGNVDGPQWPESLDVTAGDVRVHVRHILSDVKANKSTYDALIVGHSHRPSIEWREGSLLLNPGSAGPRRFRLPVTAARLVIDGRRVDPAIVSLPV